MSMLKKLLENTDYSFEELVTILESVGFTNVNYNIEGNEIVTNALSFNLDGRNTLEESVEQFYFGNRGSLTHFYKGFQLTLNYNFYKKLKVKIPFHKNEHNELINESFQRFQLLNDESKIDLKLCNQKTIFSLQNCQKNVKIKFLVMDLKNEFVIDPLSYQRIEK